MSDDLLNLVRQIKVLRDEMTMFSEREKTLKDRIIEYIQTEGNSDAKGSLSCDIDDEVS